MTRRFLDPGLVELQIDGMDPSQSWTRGVPCPTSNRYPWPWLVGPEEAQFAPIAENVKIDRRKDRDCPNFRPINAGA